MGQSVRAVYENGHFRLLESVELQEGQEIQLMILSERDLVRMALGDLLVKQPEMVDDDFDEDTLFEEIDRELRGQPPISDIIIQERNEGP